MKDTVVEQDQIPTQPTSGLTTRVVKGSLWTLLGQVLPLGVTVVATPIIIRFLGPEGYGVLILIGVIPTYFGVADFGMSIASTKFASQAYANGSPEKESRIVRTAALISLCSALPFAILLFLYSDAVIAFFGIQSDFHSQASLALKFASVTLVVNFLNAIFNTPQLTRLRMDLNTLVNTGFRILGLIATPVVLYFGGGISGVALALLIASLLTLLGHFYISSRLTSDLVGLSIDKSSVRPLLRFGGALVISGFASIFLAYSDKGVLAKTVSSEALAYYSVAFTLCTMISTFTGAMTQSLLPAFSQLQSPADQDRLIDLYSRGIRINLVVLIPVIVLLFIIGRSFFGFWAGPDFARESTLPFYILLVGLAFNLPAYFPYTSIMAAGRTDIFAKVYWLEIFPYLAILFVLTLNYGAVGAACAWSIRAIGDAILQFVLAKHVANVDFIRGNSFSMGLAALAMLLPVGVYLYTAELSIAVGLGFAVSLFVYTLITWNRVLHTEEVEWIRAKLIGLLGRMT